MRELKILLTEEENEEWTRFVQYLRSEDNPAEAMLMIALGVAEEHRKEIEKFMRRSRLSLVEGMG